MPFDSAKFYFAATWLALLGCLFCSTTYAQKYTPDHPKVQQMVDRGVKFLMSEKPSEGENSQGANCLAAYAIFKVTQDPQQARVVEGIKTAKQMAMQVSATNAAVPDSFIYSISVAGILLATVDSAENAVSIRQIRDFLIRVQKKNGGYGYLSGTHSQNSDISQTQYAMLCLWTMGQLGAEVPPEPIARCVNFMLASQNADGSWPYQFGDTGPDTSKSFSLAAAGLSALLIAGDSLGMFRNKLADNQEEEGIIPIAFRRILPEGEKRPKVDRARVDASISRFEGWVNGNKYTRNDWHYYYMYSRERYESFLEFAKGKIQKSPDWYNRGVESLETDQDGNGAWGTKGGDNGFGHMAPSTCTSFAVLFLIRSTAKAIGELHEGAFQGIDSIPDDVTTVNLSGNKIVSKSEVSSIDDALKMLEDDGKSEGEDSLAAEKMLLASDPKQKKEQLNRFARLLNAKEYKSRRIAAKMLGRGDDLDMVPALIYALTDPDPEVPFIAEKSLRLVSRQLDTSYLPKREKLTDQERAKAVVQWKKWYSNVRPEYVFVD